MSLTFAPPSPRAFGLAVALAALALDQSHKYFMLNVFDIAQRQPLHVAPFLDVVLSWNAGVSYSLLSSKTAGARLLLILFQASVVGCLGYWLWRAPRRMTAAALGFVVGGALGNVADRMRFGAVADFFFFHTALPVGPLANYVFNVADAAIFLGVVLLLLEGLAAGPTASASAAEK
ncbi:signal peptidase II [Methylosinus sp. Sm6]|uniref:signal peptidase II n=1 Tax=Methylosinus sp. Sm6 TaxID=2866948 RepID=UPI0021078B4B|nr:signal peptidase II [Methylosinus sp. Sm6]